jgi:hypothetical protein
MIYFYLIMLFITAHFSGYWLAKRDGVWALFNLIGFIYFGVSLVGHLHS